MHYALLSWSPDSVSCTHYSLELLDTCGTCPDMSDGPVTRAMELSTHEGFISDEVLFLVCKC